MRHTSAFNEIQIMVQEAADAAALNAVNVLAEWLVSKGHPELAEQMKAEWIVTEGEPDEDQPDETGGVPGEGEV